MMDLGAGSRSTLTAERDAAQERRSSFDRGAVAEVAHPGRPAALVFDRVMIRAAHREAAEQFYGIVLRTLGVEQTSTDARDARWGEFVLRHADDRSPPTRGLHIGFTAPTRGRVDEFWRAGRRPATATTARPACGRSTGRTTTAASCSIRRATAPRRCTTTSCASAGSSTTSGSASPTSRRPSGSTWPSRRTPASASATTRPSAPSSWAPPAPSRSSPARRPSTST